MNFAAIDFPNLKMNYLSNNRKSDIETDENDFDVVIVGAGLSGLAAANKLVSAGLNTLVVEKKSNNCIKSFAYR